MNRKCPQDINLCQNEKVQLFPCHLVAIVPCPNNFLFGNCSGACSSILFYRGQPQDSLNSSTVSASSHSGHPRLPLLLVRHAPSNCHLPPLNFLLIADVLLLLFLILLLVCVHTFVLEFPLRICKFSLQKQQNVSQS